MTEPVVPLNYSFISQLLESIQTLTEKKRPTLTKGPPMHDTRFESLSLRLHTPYWLVHGGNCEHFFVVDHVRCVGTNYLNT